MNEETQNQPEKALDDKRKNALLRYVAILFAVAFLFVLFSLVLQMRDSRANISTLDQDRASALQKAEQLQDTNRELQTKVEALNKQLEDMQSELDRQTEENETLRKEIENAQGKTLEAYELLLQARKLVTPGSQEGNVAAARIMENLKNLEEYLGEAGLEEYHRLLEEGE